jgi:hypothetical protein
MFYPYIIMKIKWGCIIAFIVCFHCLAAQAQVGGTSTYSFLNLAPSPQVAALGGKVNAVQDCNPALAFYNPALLDSTANNHLSLNYVNYLGGINFGYVAYARSYRRVGSLAAGLHYVHYGKFTGADESGLLTGDFTAAEYAFTFSYANCLPWLDSVFTVGINVKPLLSVFERYTSYGLLSDAGITYRHPNRLFTAALVLRNMGGQLTPYADGVREPVPFEIQLGLSQRLKYAPFRFSVVMQHLEKARLGYGGNNSPAPAGQGQDNQDVKNGAGLFADEAMRHLLFGLECFPFKGLVLRAGYNYNHRQDMKVASHTGMVGFSWGLGLHISRWHIDYARYCWHLAGASNHFSLNVDLVPSGNNK